MHAHTIALALLIVAVLVVLALNAGPQGFQQRRKRRGVDPSNRPEPQDNAVTLSVVANKLRVTCPSAYSMDGIPHVGISGGAHTGTEYPTEVTVVSSLVFDLTYAHNVAAADVVAWPGHDAACRFYDGAYVLAQNKTM